MEKDELMEYPYFFRLKMNNLNLNQNKLKFPKRALSIVSTAKVSNDNLGQLVKQKELLYSARP
jgi:hypothetical protein